MKLNDYKNILNATIVPSKLSPTEQEEKYKPLNDLISKYLPLNLNRFRECTELQIEAFYYDRIYCSSGAEVNDNFDALIYYDKSKLHEWMGELTANDLPMQILKTFKTSQEIPKELIDYLPNIEDFVSAIKSISNEQLEIVFKEFKNYLTYNLDEAIDSIIKQVQNALKFACFSENIRSASMWGYYADSGKGFALGYDFEKSNMTNCLSCPKLNKECIYPKFYNLYPIAYDNKRLNATNFTIYLFQIMKLKEQALRKNAILPDVWINKIVPCPDLFMSSKIALHKSKEWKEEREWRLFFINNDPEFQFEKHPYIIKKPHALYLGKNISAIHEKILTDIAKEKKIKIFKMSIDNNNPNYKFRAKEIK